MWFVTMKIDSGRAEAMVETDKLLAAFQLVTGWGYAVTSAFIGRA